MRKFVISEVDVCSVFFAVAVGDALGMPFETMKRAKILKSVGWDKGELSFFHDPLMRTLHHRQGFKAGETTDDWQLTAAVARAIIKTGDYDLIESYREQCVEFCKSTRGWGGSTRQSMAEINKWFESGGKRGRSPAVRAKVKVGARGLGNGVAMKIAPIAMLAVIRRWSMEKLLAAVMAEGRATHGDDRASIAAYAVAWVIARFFAMSSREKDIQLDYDKLFDGLIRAIVLAEKVYGVNYGKENFSSKLKKMRREGWCNDEHVLREECGTSCYCLESVPFAIGMLLVCETLEIDDTLAAVIAAGGDTDTNAAIIGAMLGADPEGGWSTARFDGLKNHKEVKALAKEFFDALVK